MPVSAGAAVTASGTYGENIIWKLENGTLTIWGTGPMEQDLMNSIWPWAQYADSIKKVIVEDGVTSIGHYAFGECTNLTDVELGNTVESLHGRVFGECSSLTSIYIPASVRDIDLGTNGVFSVSLDGNTEFEEIVVAENNPIYSSFDGALYSKDYTELLAVPTAKRELLISGKTRKITIHDRESEAVWGASEVFYDCFELEKIEVEKGNNYLFAYDGVLYSSDEKALAHLLLLLLLGGIG